MGKPRQDWYNRPRWGAPPWLKSGREDELVCGRLSSAWPLNEGPPNDYSSGAGEPTPPTGAFETANTATPWCPTPAVAGFEILEELGRGGMGVVYKARQTNLGRLVALKMLLAGAHAGPGALARLHKEAQAVASLNHPDIVQIHDVGQSGGLPYLSLEFIDGGSLAQQMDGRPQNITQVVWTIHTLARAIHAAHLQGIVHRDLKPANILLTVDGRPKITDFGLARRLGDDSDLTRPGTIVGTPDYMAPEQARGEVHDAGPPIDQHALGAILYELLTGRQPFRGATPADTIEQVRTQEPLPPTWLRPQIPRDLETICLKCLQKEPHRRYPDAGALAVDLERFLEGRPILARPSSALEHLGRWCRRNHRVAVLGAAVLVLLVTVATTSTVFAADLARAHRAAIAAFRRECRESYELLGDKQRAQLAVEQANRKIRLVLERSARAKDALESLVAQVRSLEDRPDLRDAKRELLRTATTAFDALSSDDRITAARADRCLADNLHRLAGEPRSQSNERDRLRSRGPGDPVAEDHLRNAQ